MIMEIIVGVIALALVTMSICFIIAMNHFRRLIKNADHLISSGHKKVEKISESGIELIHHVDKLTQNITKKSEALDILFDPFYAKKNKMVKGGMKATKGKVIADSLEFLADGIFLFDEIKNRIKQSNKK